MKKAVQRSRLFSQEPQLHGDLRVRRNFQRRPPRWVGRFPRWHLVKRETLEWWRIEQAVRTKRSVDVRRIENASFNKTCLQGGRKWHPI